MSWTMVGPNGPGKISMNIYFFHRILDIVLEKRKFYLKKKNFISCFVSFLINILSGPFGPTRGPFHPVLPY